ncbi:MAG TPA: ParB/RepB/Spo0J family partition protein, partial [Pirellulales bacterium]
MSLLQPSRTEVQADRRKRFDAKALKDLSESIRQVGIVQPIVVRELSAEPPLRYEIVAGERRWLAAQEAGLTAVPAIVRVLTDAQVLLLQLVENIQREELHPMTEA